MQAIKVPVPSFPRGPLISFYTKPGPLFWYYRGYNTREFGFLGMCLALGAAVDPKAAWIEGFETAMGASHRVSSKLAGMLVGMAQRGEPGLN